MHNQMKDKIQIEILSVYSGVIYGQIINNSDKFLSDISLSLNSDLDSQLITLTPKNIFNLPPNQSRIFIFLYEIPMNSKYLNCSLIAFSFSEQISFLTQSSVFHIPSDVKDIYNTLMELIPKLSSEMVTIENENDLIGDSKKCLNYQSVDNNKIWVYRNPFSIIMHINYNNYRFYCEHLDSMLKIKQLLMHQINIMDEINQKDIKLMETTEKSIIFSNNDLKYMLDDYPSKSIRYYEKKFDYYLVPCKILKRKSSNFKIQISDLEPMWFSESSFLLSPDITRIWFREYWLEKILKLNLGIVKSE